MILLPDNLFYNTTAAGVIVVLSKHKPPARREKIVLINASRRFTKGRPKNHIADADVADLARMYLSGESIDGEVALISAQQAADADYNLSPARWVTRAGDDARRSVTDIVADLLVLDEQAHETDAALREVLAKL